MYVEYQYPNYYHPPADPVRHHGGGDRAAVRHRAQPRQRHLQQPALHGGPRHLPRGLHMLEHRWRQTKCFHHNSKIIFQTVIFAPAYEVFVCQAQQSLTSNLYLNFTVGGIF